MCWGEVRQRAPRRNPVSECFSLQFAERNSVFMQVGQYIRLNVQFIAGFAIAFSKGWLLTLVLLAVTPALVIAGAIMTFSITRLAARGLESYAQAGSLAEQVTPFCNPPFSSSAASL
jgi:ABC-type multidrug transport system fused ATPase/permease subunit